MVGTQKLLRKVLPEEAAGQLARYLAVVSVRVAEEVVCVPM